MQRLFTHGVPAVETIQAMCARPLVLVVLVGVLAALLAHPAEAHARPEWVQQRVNEIEWTRHVGLQVGHWKVTELPPELDALHTASGAYYSGYDEWEVNFIVAELLIPLLETQGITVELLPATVPPGYQADLFLSLHADGVNADIAHLRQGWKIEAPLLASPASLQARQAFLDVYPTITGQPYDHRTGLNLNMRAYYPFLWFRYQHTIAPTTPAVLLEMGFLTHPADRVFFFEQPEVLARAIAASIVRYFDVRDPNNYMARRPPSYPPMRPRAADTPLFVAPRSDVETMRTLDTFNRLVVIGEAEGWYRVFVRGSWEIGWLPADQVQRAIDYRGNR